MDSRRRFSGKKHLPRVALNSNRPTAGRFVGESSRCFNAVITICQSIKGVYEGDVPGVIKLVWTYGPDDRVVGALHERITENFPDTKLCEEQGGVVKSGHTVWQVHFGPSAPPDADLPEVHEYRPQLVDLLQTGCTKLLNDPPFTGSRCSLPKCPPWRERWEKTHPTARQVWQGVRQDS